MNRISRSLQSIQLTSENINDWLLDWSALADKLDEQYTRLFVATTQFTNDEGNRKKIQPLC